MACRQRMQDIKSFFGILFWKFFPNLLFKFFFGLRFKHLFLWNLVFKVVKFLSYNATKWVNFHFFRFVLERLKSVFHARNFV